MKQIAQKFYKHTSSNYGMPLFGAAIIGTGGVFITQLDTDKKYTYNNQPHKKIYHNNLQGISRHSLNNLIEQSKIFCNSPLLKEVLGIGHITKATNPKEFFVQILSRELGAMIKTNTYSLDKASHEKIIQDIFTDIDKAVKLDPVEPTPFQVAVTFNGTKALMTYRFAHYLWKNDRQQDALTLSNAALNNYHVHIHPSADIEPGVFIDHAFGVTIKQNTKIGSGTYILHKAKIGKNVTIGKNVFIGAGAKITSNVTIGDNAMIAAGAHVIADVKNNKTVFGFYTQSGSAKIVPASRFLELPAKMESYYKNKLQNTKNNPKNNHDNNKSINELKSFIPFNPNSPLTVKHLEFFYQKKKNHTLSDRQTMGDLALNTSHIAHTAWQEALSDTTAEDEKTSFGNFSLWLQGRMATLFKVDIHPAAILENNVQFPDEVKKGIVIGSTAKVGDNTYIDDGVTLGGNGKERGDRHPKIDKNCYLGEDALLLGAGTLGAGSIVMPNSVLSLPKNSKTPESRVYAGKPAIDITTDCNNSPQCKSFLEALGKQK